MCVQDVALLRICRGRSDTEKPSPRALPACLDTGDSEVN